jgi:uncharacterized membrane protein YdjX (TVP38/TMEM64 family)
MHRSFSSGDEGLALNDRPSGASTVPPEPTLGEVAKRLGPAGILAIIAAAAPPLGSIALFATAGTTVPWLRAQGDAGVWLYAALFALFTGLALLPTYAQSGLAGYAFGLVNGSIASIAGFVGGGLIGYFIARRVSGERVVKLADENPKFKAIRRALVGETIDGRHVPHGFWRTLGLVSLIRLPPNSPFALMNLAMASIRVPIVPYVLGTAIGMAPRTILASAIGHWVAKMGTSGAAESEADRLAHFKSDLASAAPSWVLPVGLGVTLIVLVVLGILANRVISRLGTTDSPPKA